MKQLNKVVNDTINFIEPKMTFIELKIYDLYQGDAQFRWPNTSMRGVCKLLAPTVYRQLKTLKDAITINFVQRWRPSSSQLTIYCLICLIIL